MLKLFIYLLAAVQGAASIGMVTYKCHTAGTVDFKYVFDTAGGASADPFQHISIPDFGDNAACIQSADGTDHTNLYVQLAGVASDYNAGATVCGLNVNPGGSALLTGEFYLTKQANIVQLTDMVYTYSCDFTTATSTSSVATGSTVGATGAPTSGTATAASETVKLDIVDASEADFTTAAAVSSCTLDDTKTYKLRLYLLESTTAAGLYASSCKVKPTSSSAEEVEMIGAGTGTPGDNGCSKDILGMTVDKGFKKDVAGISPHYYSIQETGFLCFRFAGADATLHFECSLEFCATSAPACDGDVGTGDTCAQGAPAGRPKRSFGNDTNVETVKKVDVTIVVQPMQLNRDSKPGSKHSTDQMDTCAGFLHQNTFIIVVCILAVLLALSMVVSIYAVKRARDGHSTPPPYHSKGIENPSF